jgi:predicted nucleic acid-binding protein
VSGFLLDTNVLSEFSRRGDPDPGVEAWLGPIAPDLRYVSVMTIAEIRRGIHLLPAGRRRDQLELWLEADLMASFLGSNILPVTNAIADRWAALSARAQQQGLQISVLDGLIAATALEHGLTLASRNVRDFAGLQVPLLNPWDVS